MFDRRSFIKHPQGVELILNRFVNSCRKISTLLFEIAGTNQPRMVYIGGWKGNDNLGDEALFLAYKRLFPRYNFVHYPTKAGRILTLMCKVLKPTRVAVLSGGTLINRSENYLAAMRECSDIFPKLVIFGTGVANPVFWSRYPEWKDTLKQWKPLLERCVYVGVRGSISAEILKDIGINAEVIGDPVISFCDGETALKEKVMPESVGFNIANPHGKVWGNEETIQKEFTILAKLAKKAGWKVRWFIIWPRDREITLQTARDSGTEAEVYEIYREPDLFLRLVRPLSVFVGMKLHAVVLATCAYVPSVMLEYRPKCRDYMRSIEQEAFTVRTDRFTAGYVWDLISSLNVGRNRLSHILSEKVKFLRDKQISKASDLMKMFSESNKNM